MIRESLKQAIDIDCRRNLESLQKRKAKYFEFVKKYYYLLGLIEGISVGANSKETEENRKEGKEILDSIWTVEKTKRFTKEKYKEIITS
jgi:hypothetical protein